MEVRVVEGAGDDSGSPTGVKPGEAPTPAGLQNPTLGDLLTELTQNGPALDLDHCIGQYDLHTCTPETANTTHYWFATRRNHVEQDGDFNAMKIQAMHAAFETEDGPIIEAVHDEMGTPEFFSLNPVLMSNDAAPVKVRRLLKRLIAAESAAA